MKNIRWNSEKAILLRQNDARNNVDFANCLVAIQNKEYIDDIQNPSSLHQDQKMFILNIDDYAYCVPYVENETDIFLKTIFPSRKYTAFYLRKET